MSRGKLQRISLAGIDTGWILGGSGVLYVDPRKRRAAAPAAAPDEPPIHSHPRVSRYCFSPLGGATLERVWSLAHPRGCARFSILEGRRLSSRPPLRFGGLGSPRGLRFLRSDSLGSALPLRFLRLGSVAGIGFIGFRNLFLGNPLAHPSKCRGGLLLFYQRKEIPPAANLSSRRNPP